ncbi:hypothetical protein NW752_007593 [Fusarium irregulare]|uniref:Uncharacterized protein n=1 Tax=Fusarium irregulare TaxID=2494466 RepID=A0A9W8U713_9HYPO|nr:hypothetical protein NW766_010111 [Fusarium irregulare]KAJ4013297.1 hypothetical protein NW752_007593 [Fusarium irregulare]
MIDAIGIVSGVLGIIGFIQGQIPEKPTEGVAIRIKAGSGGTDDQGSGGEVSAAYAWDFDNNYLGRGDGGFMEQGGVVDTVIGSFSNAARAEYVGISVVKDAVCVAWIGVSQYDNIAGGVWTGDIGYECGQAWYANKEMAGYLDEDEKEEYFPRCTWLDASLKDGIKSASMKFYTAAYGESANDTVDNKDACDYTLWSEDDAPISGAPEKRANRPRRPWMENKLIVSNWKQHKAEDLCSSETSWGPDFIGTDGQFCDMGTKKLTPLCSTKDVDGCIMIDDDNKTLTRRSRVAKRETHIAHKTYKAIDHWESDR